jgi:peptidoglycan/LPS O-acetylase OafA/YrhL
MPEKRTARRRIAVAVIALAIASILTINFFLQSRPLFEWIPGLILGAGAAAILLLLNLAWAGRLGAVLRDAIVRRKNHEPR